MDASMRLSKELTPVPFAMARRLAPHLTTKSRLTSAHVIYHRLCVGLESGMVRAMWIVLIFATMVSLSALGLLAACETE
jgi:hypothetical protein